MNILKKTANGICAGIMVTLGGATFLACEQKIIAAVLFCIALVGICAHGYSLYTGRIGYLPAEHSKDDVSSTFLGLLGNAIGVILIGLALRFTRDELAIRAHEICTSKLEQSIPDAFIRAIMCGILMYIAVSVWREQKSRVGIFFAIPVFVMAGFEHSIADIFYFSVSGIVSLEAFLYLCLIILGNSFGSMLLPVLSGKAFPKKQKSVELSSKGDSAND